MFEEDADTFHPKLFPSSFTLLYCPYSECEEEAPFVDPILLIDHVETKHGLKIKEPSAVIPILDRYLQALLSRDTLTAELDGKEDLELRNTLQQERLKEILELQERERSSSYRRGRHCLFCNTHLLTKMALFEHMFKDHGFNIGQLDNLVMVEEFLEVLQAKMDKHICIYCGGTFPTMPVLKKHLKNKNHYRIHPQNHQYDKYYVVNYLQAGKLYDEEAAKGEKDQEEDPSNVNVEGDMEEEEWNNLTDPVDERTTCLLCPQITDNPELCLQHLKDKHNFDLRQIQQEHSLDTYESIKLVNYIRSRASDLACIYCEESFEDERGLEGHLKVHEPFVMPEKRLWQDPGYLFPIYDDDPLLCHFDE